MEKKLTVISIFSEGAALALKNAVSLMGAVVLWILTIWVPYINIGTTIAIASLPLALSSGKAISPLQIFDKKYFKYMGEYFLLTALIFIGTLVGLMFFIIPGYVLVTAWSLAILLMLDKGINPMEALTQSNKLTTGHKWTIFGAYFVMVIAVAIITSVLGLLGTVGSIISLAVVIALYPVMLGCQAVIYKTLAGVPKSEE